MHRNLFNYEFSDGDDLVSRFYKESVVFITGGTGFLGKVLVEKLLRVFLIKRIYLLVRIKNNLTVHERVMEFFEESVIMNWLILLFCSPNFCLNFFLFYNE